MDGPPSIGLISICPPEIAPPAYATERPSGETRALQPRELYKSQQYLTAVYRSELATRLSALGYDVERGSSGQPEIRGYTAAYLEASSPRRQQIEAHLAESQRSGAGAA